MLARYREERPAGLVSGRRGKPSNNAMAEAARREAMERVRERYPDFGPTFAREKLVEVHGLRLSAETLRKWMIADGLWRAKAPREVRAHLKSRARRDCVGDLVQIDGSPHAWFEDRGPGCVLIVYVDDATTRLLATGFFAEETTEAYMQTTRAHLAAHGRPVAYYSDRHSVFRVNKKDREDALTQFSRALRTLYIGRSARAAARHLRHGGGREADSGGERQNRARARPAYKAAAGPSWRRPCPPPRAWRPEDEAASAGRHPMELWMSPADRRAPFGACGQFVDDALGPVAIDRAFRRALPTGCPHSRASRPKPHSFGNKVFFSKNRKARTAKRGHFYFALTQR